MSNLRSLMLVAVLVPSVWNDAKSEPTEIVVRVLGRDSTFVGSATGGIEVILRDVADGRILAQGITEGSPGDGTLIMSEPRERGKVIATEESAVFRTVIDIEEPTKVELTARGPLNRPVSINTVSQTMWVVPGKHINEGNGWLVEMPGLIVEWVWPRPDLAFDPEDGPIEFRAHVTPMCGCGIQPNGYWPPENYQVAIQLTRNGKMAGEHSLDFANTLSLYSKSVTLSPGNYDAVLYAYDPENGNTGVDRISFVVEDDD